MKKTKRRLRISGLIIILLILYLIGVIILNVFNVPIKVINVYGNHYLQEKIIINDSKIDLKESIILVNNKKLKKNVLKNPFVNDVKVSKSLKGVINIEIQEKKILFLNAQNNKVVLEDGTEVDNDLFLLGIPTLINYTPDKIYQKLIKNLSLIDQDIISKITEIEYSPNKKDKIVLDEERFILYMNDSNEVHVNMVNFEKLSKYNEIYEILKNKGILYLDSSSKNYIFKDYSNES